MLGRRDAIKLGALGSAALLIPGARMAMASTQATAPTAALPFSVPLAVPPVLSPVRRTLTTDYYAIMTRQADVEIFPGVTTTVLGYNGLFPGPTIRAFSGREVQVTHVNTLVEETVVHLHGAHVQTPSDGHPRDPIAPGASRVYTYPNRQEASTLWYHDHAHHREAEHVYRGLAGFYLLSDVNETLLGLPSGEYDVPLMLRDARFDDSGQMVFVMGDFAGRGTVLVNGRPQPYFEVAARKYRLRVANGANERFFSLRLSDGGEMLQVASDGGMLPAPIPATSVTLAPAERVELVVDFSRYPIGTQIVLENTYGATDASKNVMRFDVVRGARDYSRVPDQLRDPLPDLGAAAVTRKIVMKLNFQTGMFELDGKTFDMDRVDQQVRLGDTEIWEISNPGVLPPISHNLHLHGVHFQVLDRDGIPVSGHETGWKDTIMIRPGGTVRFKVRFDQYAGRYLYHCHLIDHSGMGMMAQMEVAG
jgi:spore coat protein A